MTRMSPEISARWQRTVERWQRDNPKLPPPLRFEVPENINVDITARVSFGDAFIDQQRFYAENLGGALQINSALLACHILWYSNDLDHNDYPLWDHTLDP